LAILRKRERDHQLPGAAKAPGGAVPDDTLVLKKKYYVTLKIYLYDIKIIFMKKLFL
jgi:hypothetical protein